MHLRLATGTHCLFHHRRLQALRVVIVGLLAGGAADADGRSSVADALRYRSVCAMGETSRIDEGEYLRRTERTSGQRRRWRW
jgi:hypothetical protein